MKVTYVNAIHDALQEEMRRDGKVLIYGEALSRIYEKPVKAMKLWFFRLKRFVDV